MKGILNKMKFLTVEDLELSGKRVLVRSDLNVPLLDGKVTDDFRIHASLPTIEYLLSAGAQVMVASHLGRPSSPDPAFSLRPVAERMAQIGGFPTQAVSATVGEPVQQALASLTPGTVLVLENTRFVPGETKNDLAFAQQLAELCDLFVQDAFGSVHRAHASTVGIAERVKSAAGYLVAAELSVLSGFLGEPERPYVVVLGGAKISDKLGMIKSLLPKTDAMLIGGGMCFTLLAAEGLEIGKSLVEEEMMEPVAELLRGWGGDKIQLPVDVVVGDRFAADATAQVLEVKEMTEESIGLDIGPRSSQRFAQVIRGAATVFWNGPMGVFEWERFRNGTSEVANALTGCPGFTVVGGGDSVAAIRMFDMVDRVSHLSTGGGAGLHYLEGRSLPGVEVLGRWV